MSLSLEASPLPSSSIGADLATVAGHALTLSHPTYISPSFSVPNELLGALAPRFTLLATTTSSTCQVGRTMTLGVSTASLATKDGSNAPSQGRIWWSNGSFFIATHIAAALGVWYFPPAKVMRETLWFAVVLWQAASMG